VWIFLISLDWLEIEITEAEDMNEQFFEISSKILVPSVIY
jgi:hypothetical protein